MKRLYYTKTFMIFVELKKVNIFQTRLFYKMQCLIYAWIRGLSCVVTVHCPLNITFNINQRSNRALNHSMFINLSQGE